MHAEELCTTCLTVTGKLLALVEPEPPRADGRWVCAACKTLGAPRTQDVNPISGATFTTIHLK